MNTPKERLRFFIEYSGLSQSAFEKACGFSHGYVSNMRKAPSYKACLSIALRFPELNINWLRNGNGEMLKSGDTPKSVTDSERKRFLEMIAFRDKRISKLEELVLKLQRKIDSDKINNRDE